MNRDLTVGSPRKILWMFCLPMFGSIVFQQLYNIADSLVAGKFIGENALAAVGNSYNITLIFIAFAFGCRLKSFCPSHLRTLEKSKKGTIVDRLSLLAYLLKSPFNTSTAPDTLSAVSFALTP